MKIYEKPMAIVNKFEVEDVIAESKLSDYATGDDLTAIQTAVNDATVQGVVFEW